MGYTFMSRGKPTRMPTTSVRPTKAPPATKSDHPQPKRAAGSPIEDHLDCAMVRAARTIASQRGEKAMAWSEFKKKL
jgi:hypothetical protein